MTCNNAQKDFSSGNVLKMYSVQDTGNCPSYTKAGKDGGASQACKDACSKQYEVCLGTYAQECKEVELEKGDEKDKKKDKSRKMKKRGGDDGDSGNDSDSEDDTYEGAKQKCGNQYNDCVKANAQVSLGKGRCETFGGGWS